MRAGFEGDGDGVAGDDTPEKKVVSGNGPWMVSMSPWPNHESFGPFGHETWKGP